MIATPASAATKDVTIESFAYNPTSVTVNEGDTVRWTNNDPTGHSVTADDGSFDSSDNDCSPSGTQESCIKPDSPFTNTFDTAGTYAYHCRVHGSMHGTVVVKAPATTTTTQATTTTTKASTTTTGSTTTSTSSTTTTSSSTTTTSRPISSFSGPVSVNDGGTSGGSSALPLILGGLVVVAALAGLAYWLWWRSGEPYDENDGPDWTQEPPPTVQGPRI
jgi:plastocyanin